MAKPRPNRVTATSAKSKPMELRLDSAKDLSPKQFDELRDTSGWEYSDLFTEKGDPTGKGLAASMWAVVREHRPEITPQEIYEGGSVYLKELGIEIASEAPRPMDPTNAAG